VAVGFPSFLVVGAQKSGTTSLIHHLGAHPDVYVRRDEIHYFDRHADRGIEWYRSQFDGVEKERAAGESTPDYMYFEDMPQLMAEQLPGVRLVAILRDPTDRAYSHYWHNRTRGWEPLSFGDALDAEPDRLKSSNRRMRARYSYQDRGYYVRQLEVIRQHFPSDDLRVVLLDDLRDDPRAVIRVLYRFLGVDDSVVPPNIGSVNNPFRVARWRRLRRPIARLPMPARRLATRLNTRYVQYPPMDPGDRGRLRRTFAEEVHELATWLGRDLETWAA
jgi:hypothetical protein